MADHGCLTAAFAVLLQQSNQRGPHSHDLSDAREIDEAAVWVSAHEFHLEAVADIQTLLSLNQHAIDMGGKRANEGSVVIDACDHGMELLTDAAGHDDGGNLLVHLAFE